MSTLIIVESPNKIKSIQKYLGSGYTIKATSGHIRDLPPKAYGVDLATLEEDYVYRTEHHASRMRDIKAAAKQHDIVLVASDPDREGEAIAWHVVQELRLNAGAPCRIVFNEITKDAVLAAVGRPRPLDMGMVDAQRARRVLDRIVGFDVSKKICWPAGAQSAGRCQSPALHLLAEREREILGFTSRAYWTVAVDYTEGFSAFIPGEPASPGSDGDAPRDEAEFGRLVPRWFDTQAEADAQVALAKQHPHIVRDVLRKATAKAPPPPYQTATLQQDAGKKLRYPVKRTADLAQALFEAGCITYHRTDSERVSAHGQAMARDYIAAHHPAALPVQARAGRAGDQDAHECIRPARLTDDGDLPPGTADLYAMIKARFLASQSKPATIDRTRIFVRSGPVEWVADGAVLADEGYLVFWRPYARQTDEVLPVVSPNQVLNPATYDASQKKTAPPPRYSEPDLVKRLKDLGIGRPSTYPMICQTLQDKGYVGKIAGGRGKELLQPTDFGMKVDALLGETVPTLLEPEYTADMESSLDRIANGRDLTRPQYLGQWHSAFLAEIELALPRAEAYRRTHGLQASGSAGRGEPTKKTCDRCGETTYVKVSRKGQRGSFLACPVCAMTRDVTAKTKPNGCPKCGSTLIERSAGGKEKFFGCVRYRATERPCDYIERPDGSAAGRFARELTDKQCPRCKSHPLALLTPRASGDGSPFFACSDPKRQCGFTLPKGARRRKDSCPDCQSAVLERVRRQSEAERAQGIPPKRFWACARSPECTFTLDIIDPPPTAAGP